jgi:hypothetical protein
MTGLALDFVFGCVQLFALFQGSARKSAATSTRKVA